MKVICNNCENEFEGNIKSKFCSQSCSASFNNKGVARNKKKEVVESKFCDRCGKEIHSKFANKFCSSKCHHEAQKENKINNFLNGNLKDKSVRSEVIRNFLIKRQNGKCAICECNPFHNEKPLVFIVDHIDGNFMNNNPENVRAICPNCNSQTDTFTGKNKNKHLEKRHKKNYR